MVLKTTINRQTHFKDFVAQIKDNQEAIAKKNIHKQKIISITYTLVFKVGFYSLECKEWRPKAASDKTWNNPKIHFAQEFIEAREECDNYGTKGYALNVETLEAAIADASVLTEMYQDTTTTLENLATSTTTDINTFKN